MVFTYIIYYVGVLEMKTIKIVYAKWTNELVIGFKIKLGPVRINKPEMRGARSLCVCARVIWCVCYYKPAGVKQYKFAPVVLAGAK